MPPNSRYQPDPKHTQLGAAFFDEVEAANFPDTILRFRNDRWAARVGLDGLSEAEWLAHFGRFTPLPDNLAHPLALRYHGHQFRTYNPDIGDGRGFLFAQMRDAQDGRLLDLATKGSGQTPWSRSGDGRLTLKGGVREILATELLEARGMATSKSFSLVETGEKLYRGDEPSPTRSAVLTRLSHSHVRIGSFQRQRALEDDKALKTLADYCIETYWPTAADEPDPIVGLYRLIQQAVANMGAGWMAAGFVHGVLNTDNITITGESFDYGPWRFQEQFDPARIAAYFDHSGLYAYARQPESLHWNLARLAECLIPLSSLEAIRPAFDEFPAIYSEALAAQTLYRLGVAPMEKQDGNALTQDFWAAMAETTPAFEQVFFDLVGGADAGRVAVSPQKDLYAHTLWADVIARLRDAAPRADLAGQAFWELSAPADMPLKSVEAIWDKIDQADDWSGLEEAVAYFRQSGTITPPPDQMIS